MNNEKNWFEKRKEEKEKRQNMKILAPRLQHASNFVQVAKQDLKKGTPADIDEALKATTRAYEIYKLSTEYTNEYYPNLLDCQRMLYVIYVRLGKFDYAYAYIDQAVQSYATIVNEKLAKPHELVEMTNVLCEKGQAANFLDNFTEALFNYQQYINRISTMLSYYPEEMTDGIAFKLRASAISISTFATQFTIRGNIDYYGIFANVYKHLLYDETPYISYASDIANAFADIGAYCDNSLINQAVPMIEDNYRRLKGQIDNNKIYKRLYFDMVCTCVSLQTLYRMQNKSELANKLSVVAVHYLPLAINNFRSKDQKNDFLIEIDSSYIGLIKKLKQEYVPTLPADKKQATLKVLDDCVNTLTPEEYDFEI